MVAIMGRINNDKTQANLTYQFNQAI